MKVFYKMLKQVQHDYIYHSELVVSLRHPELVSESSHSRHSELVSESKEMLNVMLNLFQYQHDSFCISMTKKANNE